MALAIAILLWQPSTLTAGPFTPIMALTIREQLEMCRAVVVARLTGESRDEIGLPRGHFEIKRILAQSTEERLRGGERVIGSWPPRGKGDLFLLAARQRSDKSLDWTITAPLSSAGMEYVSRVAELRPEREKLLAYCVGLIDAEDDVVRHDVHEELLGASIAELAPVKVVMRRERLEALFANPKTRETWRGLYGLMLGLCGDAGSETLLRKRVDEPLGDKSTFGVDRTMCGYMLLAGEDGIARVVGRKLQADAVSPNERYAALCALRRLQLEAPERLSREALCRAIRPLLDRSDFADIAVSDLARLKDWDVQDKIIAIYRRPEKYEFPGPLQLVITKYLKACVEDAPRGAVELPPHAMRARMFLDTIEASP
jgi:hypothetical protein